MLKFIIGFERNASMSRDECHRYLHEVHGPLVHSVPEFVRHVRRYVQNYALADPPGTTAQDLVADGAAELWFDDATTFVTAYSEPRYLELVRPDEPRFTNASRYVAAFTRESVVWDDADGAVKLIRFLAPELGDEVEFRRCWAHEYVGAVRASQRLRGLVSRYVQSWSIDGSDDPFPLATRYAGVDEFWFPDRTAADDFCRAEAALRSESPHLPTLDRRRSVELLVRERRMPGYR